VRDHFEDFGAIRKNMTPDLYDHDGPGGKLTGVDGDEQMMLAMPWLWTTLAPMLRFERRIDLVHVVQPLLTRAGICSLK
jgi:hypothetical protein